MRPLVVGHRGASAYALENTLEAFRKAVDMGVDMIELDVRESLNDEFIVIHDRDLTRISGKKDMVHKTHSQILCSTELYNKERLLRLPEVFDLLPTPLGIMVELKSIRSYQKMGNFIAARAKERPVILTSFDLSLIKRVQESSPSLPIGIVSHAQANIAKASVMGINFENVCLDFQAINTRVIMELRIQNRKTFAWTVDRTEDIRRMIELNIDGIISNKPDEVFRILSELT
jgi:glycerophosphoryl diester phosphodiesterase